MGILLIENLLYHLGAISMLQSIVKYLKLISIIFFITIILNPNTTRAQTINTERFQYLSPVPGSKLNSTGASIIIRFGDAFDNFNLDNNLLVTGSKSGQYSGKIILAEDNKTLIFRPHNQFADGEVVTIELKRNLKTVSGEHIPFLRYSFETSQVNLNKIIKSNPEKYFKLLNPDFSSENNSVRLKYKNLQEAIDRRFYTVQQDSLPEDFPTAIIESINDPTPGCIFYTPFVLPGFLPTYLIIADNYGVPIFYRKMTANTYDLKKQITGNLTYYDNEKQKHYIMDSSYNIIDSMYMQDGYLTDLHDFIMIENKHSLLIGYDFQQFAMDTVVQGGDTNATVIGIILQELDENKKVVFQWRSWDHYRITDATYDINLTSPTIDYAHSNSIEVDYDGNILLSTRHMDEITKISRETGDIIWRWGGVHCKNNQFTFINDPIGFSHQHDVRRLPNGNITVFDNGNLHSPRFSRVAEYQIDEVNKLAFLIWEYRNNPETYSNAMGSARRLNNHNTFIGWGIENKPAISEVHPDGTIACYLCYPDTIFNYRAFKFPWKTNLFVSNPDSLLFGYVPVGDSLAKILTIKNNSEQEIEINGMLNRDSAFYVNTSLPIIIPAFDAISIQIVFKPETDRDYFDDLHLQWNKENERIAQVVPLFGTTDSTFTTTYVKVDWNISDYSLSQNYPNPFNPITVFNYSVPKQSYVTIKVYDILGNEIKTLVNESKLPGFYEVEFDASNLSSGIYFYSLRAGSYIETRKMVLIR
jgi:arylsulfate sulfotransferase